MVFVDQVVDLVRTYALMHISNGGGDVWGMNPTQLMLMLPIVASLLTSILSVVPQHWERLKPFLNCNRNRTRTRGARVSIQSTITTSVSNNVGKIGVFAEEFRAIMWMLHSTRKPVRSGAILSLADKDQYVKFILDSDDEIKIDDDITISQTQCETSSGSGKTESIRTITIVVESKRKTFAELYNHINGWVKEYKDAMEASHNNKRYVFVHKPQKEYDEYEPDFTRVEFRTRRCMDNVFFPEKKALCSVLQRFTSDPDFYRRTATSRTLGLLLTGTPGCGKTSLIKALAAHLDRHVIEVNLGAISSCGELRDIFYGRRFNYVDICPENVIIVLEDIDAMSDVVKRRDVIEDSRKGTGDGRDGCDGDKEASSAGEGESKSDEPPADGHADKKSASELKDPLVSIMEKLTTQTPAARFNTDPINLSFLLNLMDGVVEQDGRVVVITTNHPEKLDPALIRPGRIDMRIDFTRCTTQTLREMLAFVYGLPSPAHVPDTIEAVPTRTFTPAEVMCMSTRYDRVEAMIAELSRGATKEPSC
jgi:hypothetical protein